MEKKQWSTIVLILKSAKCILKAVFKTKFKIFHVVQKPILTSVARSAAHSRNIGAISRTIKNGWETTWGHFLSMNYSADNAHSKHSQKRAEVSYKEREKKISLLHCSNSDKSLIGMHIIFWSNEEMNGEHLKTLWKQRGRRFNDFSYITIDILNK